MLNHHQINSNNAKAAAVAMKQDGTKGFFGRRCGKRSHRLDQFTNTVAREWKTAVTSKENGKYTIKTPDDRFHLVISQEDSSLCISSHLYRSRSEHHSAMVMKKALELNYLTRNRQGFTLAIDPTTSKSRLHTVGLVDLTFCYSKSFVGMRLDRFRREVKDFVEVAFNVQSQLEIIGEGRLGAAPRNDGLIDYGIEALRQPESMAPMGSPLPPKRKPSPPPSPKPTQPARASSLKQDIISGQLSHRVKPFGQGSSLKKSSGNTSPSQPVRAHSITTVSTKSFAKQKLMDQFDSPAEAKLFETFMRKKALYIKQVQELKNSISNGGEDDDEDSVFCDDSDDDSVVTISGAFSATPAVAFPKPVLLPENDDGKTPVISNRKCSDEDFGIIESENRAFC
ncbi:Tir chaperone protein CesT family protein [Nitzschia inconspicua]|uniref:Tir chaperone protein CesT family protein n=1 Tax=Nitzschia inconspicua TaxID=303405 RepID=A0A9K3LVL2_9STRA|nr:Tir chaperone protein CesT family protein [Nitzschia inconspicua]